MARQPSFNFGANAKPRKTKSGGKKSKGGKARSSGAKGNAWRSYTVSNRPLPP